MYSEKNKALIDYKNADQTEFAALIFKYTSLEAGIDDNKIASSYDDFENNSDVSDWSRMDAAEDDAIGSIIDVIEKRKSTLGDSYPFELHDGEVKLISSPTEKHLVYLFCLAIVNAPNITTGEYAQLPRIFENLSASISKLLLGGLSKSLHIGWPRAEGAPKKFKELADWIRSHVGGEWSWSPQDGLKDEDASRIKDSGIDYISWIDFQDKRDGKLFITGQCACGNDWPDKFDDININKLKMWFHPLTIVKPIKAFCTPFCVADGHIIDAGNSDNIVLDRIRLTKLAQNLNFVEEYDLFEKIKGMIEITTSRK